MAAAEDLKLPDFTADKDNQGYDDKGESHPLVEMDPDRVGETSTNKKKIFFNPFDKTKSNPITSGAEKPEFTTKLTVDQLIEESRYQLREEVRKEYPELRDDVEVSQIDGVLSIRLYGEDGWKRFRTKGDSKIYVFKDKLKSALGATAEEIRIRTRNEIKKLFPKISDGVEVFKLPYGKFLIRIAGEDKWWNLQNKDKTLNKRIVKKFKDALGPTAEEIRNDNQEIINDNKEIINDYKEIISENKEKIDLNKSAIIEIDDKINSANITSEQKDALISQKDELEGTNNELEGTNKELETTNDGLERTNDGLERTNDVLEENLSLKDRIKSIFKRHGFNAISVVTAVGVIIGVIISNLKTGLAKVAKGVGNGLKDIGKKLGAILPGMIGAIASFIFKTAGEVVGFLAKNAWLLIIAVVIAVVD